MLHVKDVKGFSGLKKKMCPYIAVYIVFVCSKTNKKLIKFNINSIFPFIFRDFQNTPIKMAFSVTVKSCLVYF